jgi:methyl-accepting chemotaxis protein
MPQDNRPYKRRHYFVKKEFQFRFILKFCILILIGAIISTGLLFLFCHGTLTTSFRHSQLAIKDTGFAILPAVVYTNLITLGLVTIATILSLRFLSHKIAGPLFRFEQELKNISKGDLTKKITLRSSDQVTAIADNLNDMIASLHRKVLGIQNQVEFLRRSASEQNAPKDLIDHLNRLQKEIETNFHI